MKEIAVSRRDFEKYALKRGDVVMTEGGDFDKLGRGHVWNGEIEPCLHQNHVFAVRPDPKVLDPRFLAYFATSPCGREYFLRCAKRSTNLASINASQLRATPILLPSIEEQRRIVGVIRTWDSALRITSNLISAKQRLKRELTEKLIVGSRGRVWRDENIGSVAREVKRLNRATASLPVVSCSKHLGLVLASEFFRKRIHAADTSKYKVVSRNEYVYATNHIEEGSIGYQRHFDEALVSPMYTVFRTDSSRVDDRFMFRVLKTEAYRRKFEAATNGTVNRRGSLRWKEFEMIRIPVPPIEEQRRIADVLDLIDCEVALLQRQRDLFERQKRAVMHKLLTGEIRLIATND
jgi:type I restriction enzyme S subunit